MHNLSKRSLSLVSLAVMMAIGGCQSTHDNNNIDNVKPLVSFSDTHEDIKLEIVNRRKWDNPVIADFDQDGFQDLLLTDHGYSVKLYWNNNGVYDKGYDLIVGDMHGIGVSDYNNDGKLDVLISRGGGSGSNARNAKLYHFNGREIIEGNEFKPPLQNLRGRTSKFFDANNNGDLDLLLMGFPSRAKGPKPKSDSENFVYKNDGKGNIVHVTDLPQTYQDGQKVLITDFNQDQIDDLLIYGHNRLIALKGTGDYQYQDVTDTLFEQDIRHVTGIAEIDYDNDGDFDLYLTRARPLEAGDTFFDEKSNTFAFYTKRGKFRFKDLVIGDTFELENYQSPYPSQDIFVGEGTYKYQFEGERHRGQNVKLVSSNALGWPDKLPNKGMYVGYIGNDTWRIAGNTFSPTTGVIKGVKQYDANVQPSAPTDLLLENKHGRFVDVTQKANLAVNEHTSSVTVADFTNSGHQDLLVIKQGDLSTETSQLLWLNNGQGQFTLAKGHGVVSKELGALGAGSDSFDYNQDGFVDIIYANERGQWHLFKNESVAKDNTNYVVLDIGNSPSNDATAMGAVVLLKACGQTLSRKVGATGAPYTQSYNKHLHLGLGSCEKVDSAHVKWTNGENLKQTNINLNQINVVN
ncbi:CRTAC1 family protein [Shewanella sp. 10N.286.52.A9]|uniref:CRTAC1 family protein n=1 Tax=Shewanella sp. 10N.286.52.A9 TaxID=3229711 RepID=UPI00354BEA94